MDQMLEAAPESKSSGMGGMLGSGTSLFGGSGGTFDSMAGLAGSFSKLGLSPDKVGEFVPVVLSYVQSKGGDSVRNLLAGALK